MPTPGNRRLDESIYCNAGRSTFFKLRSSEHRTRFMDPNTADKYMLINPVRAKLSDRWEDYPWCGVPPQITNEECLE
jgi:hypothetical protein